MSTTRRVVILLLLLALVPLIWVASNFLGRTGNDEAPPPEPTHNWYKGNTHTHTLWSDGNDFPESIIHFYKENGYQFLVLTDHNILSRGEKWMAVDDINKRRETLGHPTLDKYRALFGEEWVETRMRLSEKEKTEKTEESEVEIEEVRIKALSEIRERFEKEGEFLLIEGEEVTDRHEGPGGNYEVHINAVNLEEVIEPQGGESVSEVLANNLRAIREQEERLQRPILEHLNHPNFQWSIKPSDIVSVVDLRFFEVYNGHLKINHQGRSTANGVDAVPGDEEIWDIVNTVRIRDLGVEPLLGVATDDSHHYHGGDAQPGRGWVMVDAKKLAAPDLIESMRDGKFYSSTGVALKRMEDDTHSLRIAIDPQEGASYVIEFIGTREGDYPAGTGELLAKHKGLSAEYQFKGDEFFVRVRVTSSLDHTNPSFEGQRQQAWTQPVGWKSHMPAAPSETAPEE
jgi:hypothetical protein